MTAAGTDPLARYHRQMLLPGIGVAGQQRLRESRALVVGVAHLGAPLQTGWFARAWGEW